MRGCSSASPVEARVLLAAATGALGVALLFLPELQAAMGDRTVIHGALLALGATYLASLGNMAAMRNTQSGMPVVTANAYGMAYGTVGLALIAAIRGTPVDFDPSWPYVVSLLYLSLAGTSLAFGLYLVLIKRIGPSRAAYTSVLFPVVALMVSTFFEGYRWSLPSFMGLAVLVGGQCAGAEPACPAILSLGSPGNRRPAGLERRSIICALAGYFPDWWPAGHA